MNTYLHYNINFNIIKVGIKYIHQIQLIKGTFRLLLAIPQLTDNVFLMTYIFFKLVPSSLYIC